MQSYLLPHIISLAALEILDQLRVKQAAFLFLQPLDFLTARNQLKHTIKIVVSREKV